MKATLNSINLMAADPTILKNFYLTVFGLKENTCRSQAPGFYVLEGGKGCNILLQDAKGVKADTGLKGFEIGFELDSMDDIGDRVIYAGGSVLAGTQQMGWGTAITVADPEGHQINIYVFSPEPQFS